MINHERIETEGDKPPCIDNGIRSGSQEGSAAAEQLFRGPGEVRQMARVMDWLATPLGSVAGWPDELRLLVRIVLDSPRIWRFGGGRSLSRSTTTLGINFWVPTSTQKLSKKPDRGTVAFSPTYSHIPAPSSSRILLVDDNADMRDYLQQLLSPRWQTETVANGAIALERIQQQLPDLVLTDVTRSEVDSFQLLKILRANPVTKSIPIILLSARAGDEATVAALEVGADDYLVKPFSARELIARVETQLQMSRLRQEQSANRFKNEFLMMITHELQASLVTILGWVRLLQTQSFGPKTMETLATIERSTLIESKLLQDLLDVASILSGKLQLQAVNLVALVQDVVATFHETAAAKSIQLVKTTPDATQKNVLADSDRLK